MFSRHILISGDAPVQLFLSPTPPQGQKVDIADTQGSQGRWVRGGAGILAELLNDLGQSEPRVHIHKPDLTIMAQDTNERIRSIIELDFHNTNGRGSAFLMMRSKQPLNAPPRWHSPKPPLPEANDENISLWLLQDADGETSFTCSDIEAAKSLIRDARPRLLVYHMSRSLCASKLWDTLRRGPYTEDDKQDPERLVVIVSADDLRAQGVELSHGLSWERTCQEFVEQLGSVGKLVTLVTCAHLVVLFGCDGVIYHRGAQAAKPILFFDPLSVEGEFARRNLGPIPGAMETFVAGFAKGLICSAHLSIEEGVESGLWAVRRLSRKGLAHGEQIYEASVIMQDLGKGKEDGSFLKFSIPSDEIARGSDTNWSFIDYNIGDPAEVGRRIVEVGVNATADQIPMTRFNKLVVFDRQEIESFRTLFNFLREYLSAPQNKPLMIALCGSRGSGKAFVGLQVAESALRGREVRELQFDLSQFTGHDDLLAAFHSVRDCALEGSIPLVYFNGFDSTFRGTPLGWLPHLLPPMLGGRFSDHGVMRPIGLAVFFFGTAVFTSYNGLKRRASDGTTKLQDFLNCLHGFVNVLGPNRIDSSEECVDRLYPVRRAVILRALLEQREPNLMGGHGGKLDIEDGVLNSFLLAPHYRQGIRSLKSIIAMSKLNGCCRFERAALPPPSQLDLHVDYEAFMSCRSGFPIPDRIRDELAEKLHSVYLEARRVATSEDLKDLKPWNELSQELKESSRAHTDSIPDKLRRISCFLSEKQEYRDQILSFTDDQIDLLAELEHNRWNAERLQKQWHIGERAPDKRKSPFLIPWGDLEKKWRDIDRAMVASYPTILKPYEIYKMGPKETGDGGAA